MPHRIDPSFRFIMDNAPDDLRPEPAPKQPGIVSRLFKRGSAGATGRKLTEAKTRALEEHYQRFPELRPDPTEPQQPDERSDPQPG